MMKLNAHPCPDLGAEPAVGPGLEAPARAPRVGAGRPTSELRRLRLRRGLGAADSRRDLLMRRLRVRRVGAADFAAGLVRLAAAPAPRVGAGAADNHRRGLSGA